MGNDVVGSAVTIPQRPCGIRKQVLQLVLVAQDCIQNHQSENCSDNDDASDSGTSEEECHVGMLSGRVRARSIQCFKNLEGLLCQQSSKEAEPC